MHFKWHNDVVAEDAICNSSKSEKLLNLFCKQLINFLLFLSSYVQFKCIVYEEMYVYKIISF